MRILMYALITILVVSCKNDSATSSKESDAELHIAIKKDPLKLHPVVYTVQRAREVYQYIFGAMAGFHPETHVLEPIMITKIPEAIEVTEGPDAGKIIYNIEFKKGMTWEDGKPITGADYLFTLKAIKHPETAAGAYRSYFTDLVSAELDPENPLKVKVVFDEYYMLSKEIVSTLEVYPKHIYDPAGTLDGVSLSAFHDESVYNAAVKKDSSLTTFAQQFNSVKYTREVVSGAGPYKLVDWVADQIVVLERKENYWGAGSNNPFLKAGPKRIIFHIIPDELNILNQLKSGEVDLAAGITSAEYIKLKESTEYADQFQFMTPEVLRFYFIMLNNTRPELADKNVRKALANLVDVEEIIEILEKGMAKRANGVINISKPYFNNKLALIPEDIAKAESLLKNGGWADTNNDGTIDKSIDGKQQELELDIHTTGSNLSNKIALLVQENAKQVGIKINIIQKKYSLFKRENLAKLEYDMFTSSITQSLALDDPYMKWHSSNATPGGTNQSAYKSAETDKIIENIRDAKTADQRNEQYLKLQEVMYEDQPVIFLYHPLEKIILSKKWNGKSTIIRPGYLANTFTPAS